MAGLSQGLGFTLGFRVHLLLVPLVFLFSFPGMSAVLPKCHLVLFWSMPAKHTDSMSQKAADRQRVILREWRWEMRQE